MPKSSKRGKVPPRANNLGACSACRRRHLKCDRVRPQCLNCQAVGSECTGYRSELQWVNTGKPLAVEGTTIDEHQARRPRNYLFTEESRVLMSTALQSDLWENSVDASLSELDNRFKNELPTVKESMSIGPFGVFSFETPNNACPSTPPQPTPETKFREGDHVELNPPSVGYSEPISDFNDWLEWTDLFNLDMDLATVPEVVPGLVDDSTNSAFATLFQQSTHTEVESAAQELGITHIGGISRTLPNNLKPADAETLLNHFKIHVIPHLVSIPLAGKSVWDVNNVTSAVLTLAKMTYMTSLDMSRAELANLLALCAISATHLSTGCMEHDQNAAHHWTAVANTCISVAKSELQISLQHESRGAYTAKYKDQLMATSALAAYSILYDHQQEARTYMLDSERLLRFRGLAKQFISRKARLLHHVYSWARIVGESTYVLHEHEMTQQSMSSIVASSIRKQRKLDQSQAERNYKRQSGHNARLDDFLRLEPNCSETDQQLNNGDNDGQDIRDIHFDGSQNRSGTLYMHLYGISETWLSLVSRITRLANVVETFLASKERNMELFESLEQRKTKLEHMVCSFVAHDTSPHHTQSEQAIQDSATATFAELRLSMLRAFNSALMIFFYRRIRNISPWILQEHVDKVIRALKDFRLSCELYGKEYLGSPWPSFVAGCEAMSSVQREFFKDWFDDVIRLTGFTRFRTAKECMLEVWKHRNTHMYGRDSERDVVYSWISLSRAMRLHVMLS